jgi:hypothetical protein
VPQHQVHYLPCLLCHAAHSKRHKRWLEVSQLRDKAAGSIAVAGDVAVCSVAGVAGAVVEPAAGIISARQLRSRHHDLLADVEGLCGQAGRRAGGCGRRQ